MRIFGPKLSHEASRGFLLVRQPGGKQRLSFKSVSVLAVVILVSNMVTIRFFTSDSEPAAIPVEVKSLFMLDKASKFVGDTELFEQKVRFVSGALDIAPEWLMAVMHSESKFNPAAVNHRGSGATGLIQFMVPTVKELNVRMGTRYYMNDIRSMEAHDQLNLVYEYLQQARERYGEFRSLTDLYLAILYPRAMNQESCYVLYAKPSKMYRMNSGLDENKDGQVTVSDIDRRMRRLYSDAYQAEKPSKFY